MNAPARKVDQYLPRLGDHTQALSEFELRSILRDCASALKHASTEDAISLYTAMFLAANRLGRHEDSHHYAQCAVKLDPNHPVCKLNLGVALVELGRYFDAIDVFGTLGETDVSKYLLYANMAECLARVGLVHDARSAFQDAVNVANMSDPNQLIVLANQGAIIGAEDAALELLARAIACSTNMPLGESAPLEVIANAPISLRQAIEDKPALRMAILRAHAFAGIPRTETSRPDIVALHSAEEYELATREAMALFEATKSMRARANQAVLGEVEDA